MNNPQRKVLSSELKATGASKSEIKELVGVASKLGVLRVNDLPKTINKNPLKRFQLALTISIPAIAGLVLGMFLVIASQTVLPGSPLYSIQASSDSLAAALDPSYKGAVMMKRAEQVKQLISSGAPPSRVYATLADYKKQAASYKSAGPNYAAFEYCKNNLQQAAARATNSERQAINKTLSSLADV